MNDPHAVGAAPFAPPISDPVSCGEDLTHDSMHVIEIARRFCGACEDYHVMRAFNRRSGHRSGVATDRPELIEAIGGLVKHRAERNNAPIDLVIAGAGDTGVLATAAHAAWVGSGGQLSRVRFTALDLCRTPLELCRYYADRHGITLTTQPVDLVTTDTAFSADIVVLHSLFRQLPGDVHVPMLRKLGGWLKPGGSILFSVSLRSSENRDKDMARRLEKLADVRAAIEDGRFPIGEPKDVFLARLDRLKGKRSVAGKLFSSADDVRRLFASAGMQPTTFLELSRHSHVAGGDVYPLERVFSILRPI